MDGEGSISLLSPLMLSGMGPKIHFIGKFFFFKMRIYWQVISSSKQLFEGFMFRFIHFFKFKNAYIPLYLSKDKIK